MSGLSRREVIAAASLGGAAEALGGELAAKPVGYDPRLTADGQVKLSATLDGAPAFWVYSGVIYAVRPGQHPLAILAISGCESHWATRESDGSFKLAGTTVSFFQDISTGAFIDQFDNPITGRRTLVKPNILSGGGAIYPADGSSARAFGQIKSAVIAPKGFGESDPERALGWVKWSVIGPSIMLTTDHSWNVATQPQLEAQTQSADRAAFFDHRVRRLPARYTATTIIPWMTWMDMADTPGHLVWHTSGEKGFSMNAIPGDYRRKAGDLMNQLASRPS